MTGTARRDAHDIAELPGTLLPSLHVEQCYHRYETVAALAEGKLVLEVACGAGQGLGHIARRAHRIVGGDYVERNLALARSHYGSTVPLVGLDAHRLPFAPLTFDLVVIMEAIYLLDEPQSFAREAHRVLRPGGALFVQSTNPAWRDFRPYRLARRYFDSRELADLIARAGFEVEMWGAFEVPRDARSILFSVLRRAAWRLGLLGSPSRGKDILRRFAYGALVPFPREVTPDAFPYRPLRRIPSGSRDSEHTYLYAIARKM